MTNAVADGIVGAVVTVLIFAGTMLTANCVRKSKEKEYVRGYETGLSECSVTENRRDSECYVVVPAGSKDDALIQVPCAVDRAVTATDERSRERCLHELDVCLERVEESR